VTGIVYFVDVELRDRGDVLIPTETVTLLCQMAWKTLIPMFANLTPTHQFFRKNLSDIYPQSQLRILLMLLQVGNHFADKRQSLDRLV
jgi:hypothetical protein